MSPETIVRLYKQKGYNCIAITDHDSIEGALEAKKYEDSEISVIIGEEISTDHGDLIAIGLSDVISSENFYDAIEEIKKQHAVSILPHPYKGHKDVEKIAEYVDFIEIYNARTAPKLNTKARILAQKLKKHQIAGSDAHFSCEIGNVKNIGYIKENSIFVEKYTGFQSTENAVSFSQGIKSIKTKNLDLFIFSFIKILNTTFRSAFLSLIGVVYYSILKSIHDAFFSKFNATKLHVDILFSSYFISWRNFLHKDGKRYFSDLMIGDVKDECKNSKNILCIDNYSFTFPLDIFRIIKQRRRKFKGSNEWVCFEKYLTFQDIIMTFEELAFSNFISQSKKKYDEFFIIHGEGKNFSSLINLKITEKMLTSLKPKVLVLTCEYCGGNRELLFNARIQGIPIIALQHGEINFLHRGYIFEKGEINDNLLIRSPFVQIAEKTAVFGEFYKDILTQGSVYPSESVIVTGQPRYDSLAVLGDHYSRSRFEKKWEIPPGRKIILWTTQCHGIPDWENVLNFQAVFNGLQKIDNVILFIKQHPGEGKKYSKMIRDVLANYNIDVIIVPKNADTFELLYSSDIVITRHSTTGTEAVALHKPLIVLNLSGRPDLVDYVKKGVALGVYSNEDLVPAMKKLLIDDTDLAIHREEYIQQHLYKIDGKSSERVVEVINGMVGMEK